MDTKTKYLCIVICPKKLTLAHNVFEVIELCRTQADILTPVVEPADKEEVNFLCEITYLKVLKAKDQLQASHPSI